MAVSCKSKVEADFERLIFEFLQKTRKSYVGNLKHWYLIDKIGVTVMSDDTRLERKLKIKPGSHTRSVLTKEQCRRTRLGKGKGDQVNGWFCLPETNERWRMKGNVQLVCIHDVIGLDPKGATNQQHSFNWKMLGANEKRKAPNRCEARISKCMTLCLLNFFCRSFFDHR